MRRDAVLGVGLLGVGLLGAAGLAAGPAQAQRVSKVDAAALLKLCSGQQPGLCDAYLSGIADAVELMQRPAAGSHDAAKAVACIPSTVTAPGLRATVIGYGQGHANDQTLPAANMVMAALKANYPCKASQPS